MERDVLTTSPVRHAAPRAVTTMDRWLAPVMRFLHIEAAGGVVLLACTAVALALANSSLAEWFANLWTTPVSLSVGRFVLTGDVSHLIVNDGLMTIFFFVVGLEVKREMVIGELRDPRTAVLPLLAALGGVIVPATIYLAQQLGEPGQRGWAIPMATDIAFVVGILALLGTRVPAGLKILLLSLAIVDDVLAVLIIAVVFTETIAWAWLGWAAATFALVLACRHAGVRPIGVYVVLGAFIWLAFVRSGVHPTVAGVLLGLVTPAQPVGRGAISPLQRLENGLHPWVAFVIMPVFALANAGVVLTPSSLGEPVAFAVATALALGKPVGILLACGLAVRFRVARLPDGVSWGMLGGGACLAGIGFTMALFLNTLAFPTDEFAVLESGGRAGVLAGSMVSAVLGAALLSLALRRDPLRKADVAPGRAR